MIAKCILDWYKRQAGTFSCALYKLLLIVALDKNDKSKSTVVLFDLHINITLRQEQQPLPSDYLLLTCVKNQ